MGTNIWLLRTVKPLLNNTSLSGHLSFTVGLDQAERGKEKKYSFIRIFFYQKFCYQNPKGIQTVYRKIGLHPPFFAYKCIH